MARRPAAASRAPWLEKLLAWSPGRQQAGVGVQIIRRRELEALQRSAPGPTGSNRRVDTAAQVAQSKVPGRPVYLRKTSLAPKKGSTEPDRRRPD